MSSDAEVLAEIARLSSAIDQHRQHSAGPAPTPRGRGRGRGRARGRGRGATAPHRNATWVAPHLPLAAANTSRSGTTTPNERPEPAPTPTTPAPAPPPPRQIEIGGVTFLADARGNKLVRKPGPPVPESVPSASTSNLTPRRTSHLGTTYIRTKSGNLVSLAFARDRKLRNDLVKAKKERLEQLGGVIGGLQAQRNKGSASSRGRGRGRGGRGRGRGGYKGSNPLVRPSSKPAKPKSDKLCIFFQKTGQCSRAHTCRYVHDSKKIAICPLFLRSQCPRTASTCPLSHHPNAHRSPHCQHFPACTRPECPYAHVVVAQDAKVCRAFVEFGWCELGAECDSRHVRECWRFSETGQCDVKGCKEPHVLRRVHSQESEDEDEDEDEGDDDEEEEEQEDDDDDDELDDAEVFRERQEMRLDAIEGDMEDELWREERGMKRKRAGPTLDGISGAAGRRRLAKKARNLGDPAEGRSALQDQDDFVTLSIPGSDLEDDDDEEEGLSVDSDDLADEDEDQVETRARRSSPATATTEPMTLSTATTSTSAPSPAPPVNSTVSTSTSTATIVPPNRHDDRVALSSSSSVEKKKKNKVAAKPRRHQDQPLVFDQDDVELDYGLSSSSDLDEQEDDDELNEGDETVYLEASEGFDFDDQSPPRPPRQQQQPQDAHAVSPERVEDDGEGEEDSDGDDDDEDVAKLLRR